MNVLVKEMTKIRMPTFSSFRIKMKTSTRQRVAGTRKSAEPKKVTTSMNFVRPGCIWGRMRSVAQRSIRKFRCRYTQSADASKRIRQTKKSATTSRNDKGSRCSHFLCSSGDPGSFSLKRFIDQLQRSGSRGFIHTNNSLKTLKDRPSIKKPNS